MRSRFLLCLFVVVACHSRLESRSYYFSQSIGNDSWSGLIPFPNANGTDGPKKSLEAFNTVINSLAMPGDSFLFKRNDEWRGTSSIQLHAVQGTEKHHISIGDYGAGSKPKINLINNGIALLCRASANKATSYVTITNLHIHSDAGFANGPTGIFVNESFYALKPHHIHFKGLDITNCKTAMVLYQRHITVEDCLLYNNGNQNSGQGIFASVNHLTIKNCVLDSNGCGSAFVHAMYLSACDTVLVEGNQIMRSDDGMKLRRCHNMTVRGNRIQNNYLHSIHAGGDEMGGMRNVVIESNRIYHTPLGIELKSESGIQTLPSENILIRNNIINASLILSSTSPCKNVSIYNNLVFQDKGQSALLMLLPSVAENIALKNNIVYRSSTTTSQPLVYVLRRDILNRIESSHNLYFAASPNNAFMQVEQTRYNRLSEFRASFGHLEVKSAEGEPKFLNTADFKLSSESSLCIDQGAALAGWVDRDIQGQHRPLDGDRDGIAAWDIGPYEYISPSKNRDDTNSPVGCFAFPNPVTEDIAVYCSDKKLIRLELFNSAAYCITSSAENAVDLRHLQPGHYWMRCMWEDGTVCRLRFVKL